MLENIFKASEKASTYAKSYCHYLGNVLSSLDFEMIDHFVDELLDARKNERTIFVIGNGGSAATASHMANDFAVGTTRYTSRPFKFISLADNNAVMTAIANDFGYDELFKKQLQAQMSSGDLLIAISASGNSPNILEAVKFTRSMKNKVLGISGFDGGQLKDLSDFCLNVEVPKGEYGPVEDVHMILNHLITNYLFGVLKQS